MPSDPVIPQLIDRLIACEEQPSGERLTEFRQALERKVTRMKQKGRGALLVFFAGAVTMGIGVAVTAIAAERTPSMAWLTATGFFVVLCGAIVVVLGSVGLLLYRGFGYVWARHDLQEAAIWELTSQVERLSQQVEEVRQSAVRS